MNTELNQAEIYRIVAENTYDWEELIGADGSYLYISPSCERITGYSREEFYADPGLRRRMVHPADRQAVLEHVSHQMTGSPTAGESEFRIITRNGETRWISHYCQPAYDASGAWIGSRASNRDISDRKNAEARQKTGEEYYRQLVETSTDFIGIADLQGNFLMVNQQLATRHGYDSPQEVVGHNAFSFIAPEDNALAEEILENILETGQPTRFTYSSCCKDGRRIPVEANLSLVRDVQGSPIGIMAVARDLTDRLQAEQELRQSEATIRALLNSPLDVVTLCDPQGNVLLANQTFADNIKKTIEEIIGRCLWDLFPPHVIEFRKAVFERVLQTGESIRTDDRGAAGGFFDSLVFPILDEQGQVIRVAVMSHDVTQLKTAEQKLLQQDSLLRNLIENAPLLLVSVDQNGIITMFIGKEFERAGISTNLAVGINLFAYAHIWPEQIKNVRKALAGEDVTERVFMPLGDIYDASFAPIRDQAGAILGASVVIQNVTGFIRAQEEIRRSEQQLKAILQGVSEGIYAVDPSGKVVFANLTAAHRAGYLTVDAMLKKELRTIDIKIYDVHGQPFPEDRWPTLLALKGLPAPETQVRSTIAGEDQEHWTIVRSTPILDEQGNVQLAVTISQEVTEIKQAQLALQQARDELEKRVAERTAELAAANLELNSEITERRRLEATAKRQAARAESLARIAGRVNARLDLPSVLQAICEETAFALGMSAAGISLYDAEQDTLSAAATYNMSPALLSSFAPYPRELYDRQTQLKDSVLIIPDAASEPLLHGPLIDLSPQVRTIISTGLVSQGEIAGILSAANLDEACEITQEEVDMFQAIASQAAVSITNARLFKQISEEHKRLELLSQKLVDAQETERRRIGLELHDEIGQVITSMKIQLDMAVQNAAYHVTTPTPSYSALQRIQELASQLLQQVRDMSLDLRPRLLDELGLLPALIPMFERFTRQTDIRVNFKQSNLERRLPREIEVAAYRIIQEALTNVARHAQVQEVAVRLWCTAEEVGLQVEDQGIGFEADSVYQSGQTSGLLGMRERVTRCGGWIEIDAQPGKGACITVELPLSERGE
ncbi:MAG: PAS domain S-box protein [Anaerolineales bacterium]|nr:PAS domain S-box protein [Anaerolineales bacterium]